MLKLPDLSPLLPWYEANKRDLPWRHTTDPYRIWVSEIMLQQTRVEAVLPYYARFLDTLPTVSALAQAEESLLLKLWEGLGYYSRVRNMAKAARSIMTDHGGVFPATYADIRTLCGIGDYTAGAIASFAFGLPAPAVDGNVLRVTARLLCYERDVLCPAAKKELTAAVEEQVKRLPPATLNQALMELGATVCLPNGTPHCEACPLQISCAARQKGKQEELPIRKKPQKRRIEEKTVLIIRIADRIALQKRPQTGLLAGLFEPFCLPGKLSAASVSDAFDKLSLIPLRITPLGDAKHIFTHLEWHMTGFEVLLEGSSAPLLPASLFLAPREKIDEEYALPSAFAAYRAFM